ncbi:ABC transporter ATP-binding protein [Erysipelotrichaceae bacterium OttesenSCG-928-M19]|nr:ABC transporter ATP-binding protein [Erysipelotrichaceae bacterium OttesenSCG-928-M19]
MKKTIVAFENINKAYDQENVIENFNLKIVEEEFLTIIGSSGCGKTTVLKMINGLIKPSSGVIKVYGENLETTDLIELRRKIGYVIQNNGLFPHYNVRKNIEYVATIKHHQKDLETRLKEVLDIVSLDYDILKKYPDELSGGQQQRVGLARALFEKPQLILMDEPLGAIDEITRKQLQKEIKKIHQQTKTTIIFVTHDIQEALTLGTKVMVMNEGRIIQYDTPVNIKAKPANEYVKKLIENVI